MQVLAQMLPWIARLSAIGLVAFMAVFVGYSSIHATPEDDAEYGGLSGCFACNNGWDWHVVLFTLAYPLVMAESLLSFKAPIFSGSHSVQKSVHLSLQTAAVALIVAGTVAIVQAKQATASAMMYSVHSWCGAIALFMFALQYLSGVAVYLLFRNIIDAETRSKFSLVHTMLGKLTFFAGIATCVNGWADMQMMMVDSGQYHYGSATMLGSASAVLYWLQAAVFLYILSPLVSKARVSTTNISAGGWTDKPDPSFDDVKVQHEERTSESSA